MALDGITTHARLRKEKGEWLNKKRIVQGIKDGLIIITPAENGMMAFCHIELKIAAIADRNITFIKTFSEAGKYFRLIEKVQRMIEFKKYSKKILEREILYTMDDGTKAYLNKKETRIRRIYPRIQSD